MNELRKVIAIDFDGCLCKNIWPDTGLPNFDAINAAIQAKQEGAALILWTCRSGEKLEDAIRFCKNYGLEFDAVNDNLPERIVFYNANPRKVIADEYWDDRSVFVSATDDERCGRFMGGPGDDSITVRDMWNQRTEQPNVPLTLDELRQMGGEPVWIQPAEPGGKIPARWMLFEGERQDSHLFLFYPLSGLSQGYAASAYRKTWLAYRRRPETVQ